MRVTPRDLTCLQVIDRYGIMTTKQLHKTIFPQTDVRTVLRRLRKLEIKKLISRHHGLPNANLVWSLAQSGLNLVGSRAGFAVNRNSLEHDILVSAVRLELDRLNLGVNWQSSHALRQKASLGKSPTDRFSSQIPDALFIIETDDGPKVVALEVEIVAKSKRRYRDIIANYSFNRAIDYIWYVVGNSRIGSLLLEEVERIIPLSKAQERFVWTDLSIFLSNPLASELMCVRWQKPIAQVWPLHAHPSAHTVGNFKDSVLNAPVTQVCERTE